MANTIDKKILKIFRNYDFNGNRIKNVKVDIPTKDAEPTPKSFVDEKSLYNTEIAQQKKDSTKFTWLKDLYGKTIKQVLDELLFAENSIYHSPTITSFKFIVDWANIINVQDKTSKIILFENQMISGKFIFDINSGGRTQHIYTTPSITVKYPDFNTVTYYAENNKNEIIFNFTLIPGTTITFHNQYNEISGENIPVDFQHPYIMDIENTIDYLFKDAILYPSIFAKIGDEAIKTFDLSYIAGCSIDNKIIVNANNEAIINVFIPNDIIKISDKINYPINLNVFRYNQTLDTYELLTSQLIQYDWFTDCGTIDINGTIYKSYQINFGTFNERTMFQFDFSKITSSNFLKTSNLI